MNIDNNQHESQETCALAGINQLGAGQNAEVQLEHIPTGVLPLDRALGGGVRPGAFNVVCAYTGHGKSSFMVHIAQCAARMGHPVLLYHNEMDTQNDYYPRLTRWEQGGGISVLPNSCQSSLIEVEDIRQHLDLGLAAIHRDVARIKETHERTPVIIVDSLDGRAGGDRLRIDRYTQELTDLAETKQAAVWATSQANDHALKTDVVSMECLRDTRGKAFPCSLYIGIHKYEAARSDGRASLTIDKNRHGERWWIRAKVDWASCRFYDVDDTYLLPVPDQNSGSLNSEGEA